MRMYLLDVSGIAAWKHFAVSDSSEHGDLLEGVAFWWSAFKERFSPELVVGCLDCSRQSNWRKQLFAEYKSARDAKPKDEALAEGLRRVHESLPGVTMMRVEGYEADDIIATLAEDHDDEVIIVSTDKDMHQLVDERIKVYDPRPNKAGECIFYDAAMVEQKHGVPPNRLRELLAIAGDAADSIPGVAGWGRVSAITAIKQTHSRLELLRKAKAKTLQGITPKRLESFDEQAFNLSYELVGFRRADVSVPDGGI